MPIAGIAQGLGIGGGTTATISGAPAGGGAFTNDYSVSFDGEEDYMDTGSTFQSTVRGGFSVSFWMKFSSLGSGVYAPFGSWDDVADQNAFYISNPAGGQNVIYRLEVGSSKITLGALPTGGWTTDWHHIAVTCEQSGGSVVAKIYIDGVYKATASMTATLSSFANTQSIYVGARNRTDGRNAYFPGLVDEVAIFGSVLSDGGVSTGATASGDIASIYNSGAPGDIDDLSPVSWWRMGDSNPASAGTSVSLINDVAGSNNLTQSTASSQPTISTNVPS